jgi:DNA-binding response OmpR family regulator
MTGSKKILMLEDDADFARELSMFLENQGYCCSVVSDGALFFKEGPWNYDLFLLDINVPTFNGVNVCRKIRETDKVTPIMMLTAYSAVTDKITALDYGADDYLVKPFHFDELIARIKAVFRREARAGKEEKVIYQIADLEINTMNQSVTRGGRVIRLTPKEYKLLELLVLAKGMVVSKQHIVNEVWGDHVESSSNTMEVYVNFLRNKIDKEYPVKLIHTRPGFGYYLKPAD